MDPQERGHPTVQEHQMTRAAHNPGASYAERRDAHDARERVVWNDYLRHTKGCAGDLERYARSEPQAWRRLRRDLTELAHLRLSLIHI